MNDPVASAKPVDVDSGGNILVIGSGAIDDRLAYTELWMPDGQVIRVATQTLRPSLVLTPDVSAEQDDVRMSDGNGNAVIPIVEERVVISKQSVPTAKIRLRTEVEQYEQTISESLAVRTFDVERIVLNAVVDSVPTVRQEGETTIYPLVEERLVLTKELVLKEEIRVTRRDTARLDTRTIHLQRETMTVEREALGSVATQEETNASRSEPGLR